ncbi:MAG: ribonuclease HII, partial [Candidatus Cloacimonadaceae bacterium]|nr:ribonuclease HII [Candidatus Cloacimonadaceae bacterium]
MNPLYERDLDIARQHGMLIGIDEAGRGSWAGPVVIAACILDYDTPIEGLNDSKKLSYDKRARLFDLITQSAVAYRIVEVSAGYIDSHNILAATMHGMMQSIVDLPGGYGLIDGNQIPKGFPHPCRAVIKGDSLHA